MSKILAQQLTDLHKEILGLPKNVSHQEIQKKVAYVASTICSVLEQAKEHTTILQEHISVLSLLKNTINNRIFDVFIDQKSLYQEFNNKIDRYIIEYLQEIPLIQNLEIMTETGLDFKEKNNQNIIFEDFFTSLKNLEAIEKLVSQYEIKTIIQKKICSLKKNAEPLVLKIYDNQFEYLKGALEKFEKIESDFYQQDMINQQLTAINGIIKYLENVIDALPSKEEYQELFEQIESIKRYIAIYNQE